MMNPMKEYFCNLGHTVSNMIQQQARRIIEHKKKYKLLEPYSKYEDEDVSCLSTSVRTELTYSDMSEEIILIHMKYMPVISNHPVEWFEFSMEWLDFWNYDCNSDI